MAAQLTYEMGKKAIEILLKKLGSGAPDQYRENVSAAEIVIQQSSGQVMELIR